MNARFLRQVVTKARGSLKSPYPLWGPSIASYGVGKGGKCEAECARAVQRIAVWVFHDFHPHGDDMGQGKKRLCELQ